MEKTVAYVCGKDGSAAESEHYRSLFPGRKVVGLAYQGSTPWEAGAEIRAVVEKLQADSESIILIANSIGAYFSMNAGIGPMIARAYFISPVVDMDQLIIGMMNRVGVTEDELEARGEIPTPFGEALSWAYLSYVRKHPLTWRVPTAILYGEKDWLVPYDTVARFAKRHGASLTVMKDGEHWFHTAEQMRFLNEWIRSGIDREEAGRQE